ncbi:hypothetical protein H1D32_04650 [Anaerobacillus sp. CMMVII]|uniref:hypothetical protein n=1 Tax=Anaerobacillus sp. CMMVII TaxID=2755588 RepID=UPI0021B7C315|nr:hypothetical protein [Anaerobacillus sp. CMMVII]MCT8137089.1 hypothetical protein [Anaerobacillus sp. CMMVII]
MKLKISLLFCTLLVFGGLLIGCSGPENKISSELLITEKVLPVDFYELANQGVLVNKVTNQEEFNEQWTFYQLQGTPTELDWNDKVAIFLGVFESGSCPYGLDFVEINTEKTDLIFNLKNNSKGNACTDDATPRTFVVAVNKDEIADVTFVVVENYSGIRPRVEFYNVR